MMRYILDTERGRRWKYYKGDHYDNITVLAKCLAKDVIALMWCVISLLLSLASLTAGVWVAHYLIHNQ